MPLLALVDGERTVSSLFTDEAWLALQKRVRARAVNLTLRCGQPGHPKRRQDTRFFAHNPGTGHCAEHTGETPQHLRAKDIIVRAAVAAGWDAQPEVRGEGWVADVLAEKDGRKIAFEVQWSPQTDGEYTFRQDRYKQAGVRAAWFVRHKHSVPRTPTADLPVFLLGEDGDDMTTVIGSKTITLERAVAALLQGQVKHREYVSNGDLSETSIRLHKEDCWKCAATSLIWDVEGSHVVGNCGQWTGAAPGYGIFATERVEASAAIRSAAAEAATGQGLPLAKLGPRYTKTSGTTYMAFSCPQCNAVFGDMFVRQTLMQAGYDGSYRDITRPGGERGLYDPHWCYDQGSGHCALPPDGYTRPEAQPAPPAASPTVTVQTVGESISIRQAINTMFGGSF